MKILDKLRERKERKEREKEVNRYAEENRLIALEKQEKSTLEQDRRIAGHRNEILKVRAEKRKLNPGIIDKLFKPVGSRPNKREKAYPSVYGSSKRQASSAFSTVSSGGFNQGFTDVLGSSIYGRSNNGNRKLKHRPVYIKKGKKFIKMKGKHKSHKSRSSNSGGYDPIWGHGMGL